MSPDPGDKPMTQRALTVLMVVSGVVLVYFCRQDGQVRRSLREPPRQALEARLFADLLPPLSHGAC